MDGLPLLQTEERETILLNVPALFSLIDQLEHELHAAQTDDRVALESIARRAAIFHSVNVAALSAQDTSMLYYKLYKLLALHGAVVLGISVTEVKRTRASEVAYAVGTAFLTLADLHLEL
jgi:hypothetical protein